MTSDDIFEQVKNVLVNDFQVTADRITPQATFRGTLALDSLDAVDLIYLLSKTFSIPADLPAFSGLHTVQSVVDHVARERAKSAGTER